MQKIDADSWIAQLRAGERTALIDVRSELEFARASIPQSINQPLLWQSERHEIGIAYKQNGQAAAIALGEKLIAPFQVERTLAWTKTLQASARQPGTIMCWRGGLRSQIVCDWLRAAGQAVLQLDGGYKALRGRLRQELLDPPPFIVLSGLTGGGKTELMQALALPHVDLEAAALHRGSAFGGWVEQPQPTQGTFENDIGLQLAVARHGQGRVLVEDESRMIGRLCVPESLLLEMRRAPLVILQDSVEARAARIYREYIAVPLAAGLAPELLQKQTYAAWASIERNLDRHAPVLRELMDQAFQSPLNPELHQSWIGELLRLYYDKRYLHSAARSQRPVLFEGDAKACREFLTTALSGHHEGL